MNGHLKVAALESHGSGNSVVHTLLGIHLTQPQAIIRKRGLMLVSKTVHLRRRVGHVGQRRRVVGNHRIGSTDARVRGSGMRSDVAGFHCWRDKWHVEGGSQTRCNGGGVSCCRVKHGRTSEFGRRCRRGSRHRGTSRLHSVGVVVGVNAQVHGQWMG